MTTVGLLGTLGVVLSLVFAWPQAVRARRAPDLTGVSAPATLLLVLTATTWLLYAAAVRDPALVLGNVVTAAAAILTLVTLLRRGAATAAGLAPLMAAWILLLVLVLMVARVTGTGPGPVGILGAALGVSMSLPQAWRTATGHGTAGVSLATYVLLLAVMATWLAYGLAVADPVLWVPNVVGVAVVGAVVAVLVGRSAPGPEPDARVMSGVTEG